MFRRSKECVINVPTRELIDSVVRIGNVHGTEGDKFERFRLTPVPARSPGAGCSSSPTSWADCWL
jgi:flavin reductase (DIM6/NTAB) family NADH-FMN oxidoreductase RutF